jgi:hypothetical protein
MSAIGEQVACCIVAVVAGQMPVADTNLLLVEAELSVVTPGGPRSSAPSRAIVWIVPSG